MPKVSLPNFDDIEPAGDFVNYVGPVPPRGLYRTKLGTVKLVKNNSGDPMFKLVYEIDEPEGSPKARYNGYAIWHNANMTRKSAPFVKAMFIALGFPGTPKNVVTEDDGSVKKIGGTVLRGLSVLVNAGRDDSDEYGEKLVAKGFSKVPDNYEERVRQLPENDDSPLNDDAEPETDSQSFSDGDADEDAF